jgi:hypothetical protein
VVQSSRYSACFLIPTQRNKLFGPTAPHPALFDQLQSKELIVSYQSDRFKEGLKGKKPGNIYIDEEGHRAQERGYEAHLTNEAFAEEVADALSDSSSESSGWDDDHVSDTPITIGQRIVQFIFGSILLQINCAVALFGAYWIRGLIASRTIGFLLLFFIFPGGLILMIAAACFSATFKRNKKIE